MTTPQDPGYTPDPNQAPTPGYTPPGPGGYTPPPAPGAYTPPPGPGGYVPPPAPPAKKTNWLGLAIIFGIIAVLVIGYILFRDRLGGEAASLRVGDCFDIPAELSDIDEVQHHPCNTPHDAEVFLVFTHPGGSEEAYPVVSGFDDFVQEQCTPAFANYTGRPWATETELSYGWFQPTLTSWGNGDRGFTCHITRADDEKLSITVRNVGTSPLP